MATFNPRAMRRRSWPLVGRPAPLHGARSAPAATVDELLALSRLYKLDPAAVAADELTFQRLVRGVRLLSNWHEGTLHIKNGLDILAHKETQRDDHTT